MSDSYLLKVNSDIQLNILRQNTCLQTLKKIKVSIKKIIFALLIANTRGEFHSSSNETIIEIISDKRMRSCSRIRFHLEILLIKCLFEVWRSILFLLAEAYLKETPIPLFLITLPVNWGIKRFSYKNTEVKVAHRQQVQQSNNSPCC